MTRLTGLGAMLAVTLAHVSGAAAEEPRLLAMADTTPSSHVGVDVSTGALHFFDDELIVVTTADLLLEVALAHGIKLTGVVPISAATYDDETAVAMGNLTAGARLVGTRGALSWALSSSLSAPTASDRGAPGRAASSAAELHFAEDPGLYQSGTTTVRAAGTLRHDRGPLTLAAEVSYRLHIFTPDELEYLEIAHACIGGGLALSPTLTLLGELDNLTDHLERRYEGGDHFYHVLSAGLRYSARGVSVLARVVVPLDDELRDSQTPLLGLQATTDF